MFGVADEVDIHIGTLSKGFGSHGGFVAGSSLLKSFLMNKGRSYVFSTALPLPAVAAAQAAIHVCRQVTLKPVHSLVYWEITSEFAFQLMTRYVWGKFGLSKAVCLAHLYQERLMDCMNP